LLSIAVWVLLSASPLGQLEIRISAVSSQPGLSQVYAVAEDGAVAEERSHYVPVRTGENLLSFPITPITSMKTDTFRWDPLDTPAEIKVLGAEVRSLFIREPIALDSFTAQVGVVNPRLTETSLDFTTGSNDAQMVVKSEAIGLYERNLLLNAVFALLIGTGLSFAWAESASFRRRWRGPLVDPVRLSLPGLPRSVSVVAGVVTVVNVVALILGSQRIGAMWDGRSIVDRTLSFLLGGWFIEKYGFEEGMSSMGDTFVYAPLNGLLPHVVSVLAGNESWLEISHSGDAYASRNLAVAGLSLLGILAVAFIARILFASWRWALLAAAVASAIPAWTGQGMFNVKDIPTAAGYTIFTLGLVTLTRFPSSDGRVLPVMAGSSILGSVLAVGTRPGMWAPLVLSAIMLTFALALGDLKSLRKAAWKLLTYRLSTLAGFAVITYGILLVLYPRAFSSFPGVLIESVTTSAAYPINISTLTAGQVVMSSNTPWFYVPVWLAAQTPLLIGASVLVAAILGLVLWQRLRNQQGVLENVLAWIPVALQALLLPAAVIILNSNVFNGTRHFVFVFPAIALIATAGFSLLLSVLPGKPIGRILVVSTAVVAIVLPTFVQLRLFPYGFVYVNPIAAAGGVNKHWELDFQGVAAREALAKAEAYKFVTCDDEDLTSGSSCEANASVAPYLTEYYLQTEKSGAKLNTNEILLLHQDTYGKPVRNDCVEVSRVERPLFGQQIYLYSRYECPAG